MVFRRRRRSFRRPIRRMRRRFIRRSRRLLPRRLTQLKPYRFSLIAESVPIPVPAGGVIGGMNFRLDQAVNYDRYCDMFDSYRIRGVSVTFYRLNYGNVSATGRPVMVYYVPDYNNSDPPISPLALASYQGVKKFDLFGSANVGRNVRIFLRPKVANVLYGGVTSAYTSSRAPWITCQTPDAEHYGLKYAVAPNPDAPNAQFNYQVKYWVEFRGVQPAPVD